MSLLEIGPRMAVKTAPHKLKVGDVLVRVIPSESRRYVYIEILDPRPGHVSVYTDKRYPLKIVAGVLAILLSQRGIDPKAPGYTWEEDAYRSYDRYAGAAA